MADDPYSRLYWRLSDEFPDVFDDPLALGTYVQLLVTADAMWPSKPHVPAGVDIGLLLDCGLVIQTGRRYAIKGLDKERKKRQKAGRKGAAGRWPDSDRNAVGNAVGNADRIDDRIDDRILDGNAFGMPSRAKPSQDETRRDEPRQAAHATKSKKKADLTSVGDILQRSSS